MKRIPTTVLITTANNPPHGVPAMLMTNVVMRSITAKAALYFWVAQGVENIVLADATGSNLLKDSEVAEIEKLETRIEQINYKQNAAEVIRKGKGYGEGRLIEYAVNNSQLLAREEHFFKCTGKIYVRNFLAIVDVIKANGISSMFWRHMGDGVFVRPWADCRFYFTSKDFATRHLIPAYLESDETISICECNVFVALSNNMRVAKAHRPLISGYSGHTGDAYFDLSLGHMDNSYPCWVTRP